MLLTRALRFLALVNTCAAAVSVCDVLNARNATRFCEFLTGRSNPGPDTSGFNNQTTNITVLAFTDAVANNAQNFVSMAALMTYHIMRGVYSSGYIANATGSAKELVEYILLDTFLDDITYENVTGGQKVGAGSWDGGKKNVRFWAGGSKANAQTLDLQFDGGLIHIIDEVLIPPGTAHEKIPQVHSLTGYLSPADTSVLSEALYLTGLMSELESRRDVTLLAPYDTCFYVVGSIFNGMTMDELRQIIGYLIIIDNSIYADAISPMKPSFSYMATTLSGKKVKVTHEQQSGVSRQGVIFDDSVGTHYVDIFMANGNILNLKSLLDPNNPTGKSWPNAKSVSAGTPLFTNIVSTKPSSTPRSASSSQPASSNNSTAKKGLSTGAKAGIGIGIAVVLLVLLGLAVWWFVRWRRTARSTTPNNGATRASENIVLKEEETKEYAELESKAAPRHELGGDSVGPELPGTREEQTHELMDSRDPDVVR